MLIRFILYGLGGWCGEVLFTPTRDRLRGRVHDWKLKGTTYLWMFPLYGSIVLLYEPLHDAIRSWPWLARGAIYVSDFFAVGISIWLAAQAHDWNVSVGLFRVVEIQRQWLHPPGLRADLVRDWPRAGIRA